MAWYFFDVWQWDSGRLAWIPITRAGPQSMDQLQAMSYRDQLQSFHNRPEDLVRSWIWDGVRWMQF